jgi:pyruvate/2-oxoglutarate dehydrogenase complex dihydrolipoamide acyltransferase (E2) component
MHPDELAGYRGWPMAYLSLSFDHRIMDGAIADRFLSEIVDPLEGWS